MKEEIRLGRFDKWGYKNSFSKGELARELTYMNRDYDNLQSQLKAKEEENKRYRELGFKYLNDQNNKLKEVIKEAREYIKERKKLNNKILSQRHDEAQHIECEAENDIIEDLLEILSKGENK